MNKYLIILILGFQLLGCSIDSSMNTEDPSLNSPLQATNLKALKVTYDNATQLAFSWEKDISSETVDGYRVSFQAGVTPPTDCSVSQFNESQVTSTNIVIYSLTANTDYSFRVCSVKGGNVSDGITMTVTTPPLCDYNVAPGSLDDGAVGGLTFASVEDSVDSYLEFENFLAAAALVGDTNADGMLGICLMNGLTIVHSNTLPAGYINVVADNVVIYANSGDVVTFDDQRTNPTGVNNAMIRFEGLNQSMMNIRFNDSSNAIPIVSLGEVKELAGLIVTDTGGSSDGTITAVGGKITRIHNSTINSSPLTSGRGAIYFFNDNISEISSVTISSGGSFNYGIYNRFAFGSTATIKDSSITTTGSYSSGIYVEFNTNGITIQNTSVLTSGDYSDGILVWNGKLGEISKSTIQTQGASSSGVSSQNGQISSITDSVFTTGGNLSHGLFLGSATSVLKMENTQFIRQSTNSIFTASAVVFEDDQANFVVTNAVRNNYFCSNSTSLVNWTHLLATSIDGVITGFASPTVAYDPSTVGAQTFPWGDAAVLTNGSFNLQSQWDGPCSVMSP